MAVDVPHRLHVVTSSERGMRRGPDRTTVRGLPMRRVLPGAADRRQPGVAGLRGRAVDRRCAPPVGVPAVAAGRRRTAWAGGRADPAVPAGRLGAPAAVLPVHPQLQPLRAGGVHPPRILARAAAHRGAAVAMPPDGSTRHRGPAAHLTAPSAGRNPDPVPRCQPAVMSSRPGRWRWGGTPSRIMAVFSPARAVCGSCRPAAGSQATASATSRPSTKAYTGCGRKPANNN